MATVPLSLPNELSTAEAMNSSSSSSWPGSRDLVPPSRSSEPVRAASPLFGAGS